MNWLVLALKISSIVFLCRIGTIVKSNNQSKATLNMYYGPRIILAMYLLFFMQLPVQDYPFLSGVILWSGLPNIAKGIFLYLINLSYAIVIFSTAYYGYKYVEETT